MSTQFNNVKFKRSVGTTNVVAPLVAYDTATFQRIVYNPNAYSTPNSDRFGYSLDVYNNTAIVGAHSESFDSTGNTNSALSGVVYLIDVTTGNVLHTITNPNIHSTPQYDYFGFQVSIGSTYCAVGAKGESAANLLNDSGMVYLYEVSTGNQVATIHNPNLYSTEHQDYFGHDVIIRDNYLFVSAYYEEDAGGDASGKVYVYKTNTGDWSDVFLDGTLHNPNVYSTSAADEFGYSIDVSDNYIVVGAHQERNPVSGASYSGAVYIFDRNTYNLLHSIQDPDATSLGGRFGRAVACTDEVTIAANHQNDSEGTDSGRVYIFDNVTGNLIQTLTNPNTYSTTYLDYFGYHVYISGKNLFVSGESGFNSNGAVYIYELDTYTLVETIQHPTLPLSGTNFGVYSIAASGTNLVVGAAYSDEIAPNSGQVVIFELSKTS